VGESGSGKSTLARVIAGLDPLDSGALAWPERPLRRALEQRPRAFLRPYTEVLLGSEPRRSRQAGPAPATRESAPRDRPTRGCPYQHGCPRKLGSICETDAPPWRETADGGGLLCHIPLAELRALQSQA